MTLLARSLYMRIRLESTSAAAVNLGSAAGGTGAQYYRESSIHRVYRVLMMYTRARFDRERGLCDVIAIRDFLSYLRNASFSIFKAAFFVRRKVASSSFS